MVLYDYIGARKSTFASFLVMATLAISVFPANAGDFDAAAVESSMGGDGGDCGESCGELIMLEDFAGPKHKWVETNDPGTWTYFCAVVSLKHHKP